MIGVNQKIIFCFAVMMGASASANVWGPPPDLSEVTGAVDTTSPTHEESLTDFLADAIPMPEGVEHGVDIHTISCGGTIHKAGSKLFDKIAVCLKGKARVLWKVKNHHKHFHLEFGGCNKKRGCGK